MCRGRPLHHVALVPRDHKASLTFYRDGLGLQLLADFDGLVGKWTHLFNAPSDELRSIFLGSPDRGNAGVVELVLFGAEGEVLEAPERPCAAPGLGSGFFLLSFYVDDVDATIARLEELGVADDIRTITIGESESAFTVATVRDPDGTLIELVGLPSEQGFGD